MVSPTQFGLLSFHRSILLRLPVPWDYKYGPTCLYKSSNISYPILAVTWRMFGDGMTWPNRPLHFIIIAPMFSRYRRLWNAAAWCSVDIDTSKGLQMRIMYHAVCLSTTIVQSYYVIGIVFALPQVCSSSAVWLDPLDASHIIASWYICILCTTTIC